MANLRFLWLFAANLLIYIHSSCAKNVALDTTLSKAICKQMKDFQASRTIQSALEDQEDAMPSLEGCGWVDWKQCPDGNDCSSFAHKRGKGCPSGGNKPVEPAPGNGGSPSGTAGGIFKMSLELDGQEQCYLIDSSAKVSHKEAAHKCRGQGGRLLAVESERENVIVEAVLGASDQYKNKEFWTDAELAPWGNKWKTSRQTFQYTGPSLTNSGHNCMAIKISGQKLHWISSKCGSTHFTFCEMNSSCEKVSGSHAPPGIASGGGGSRTGSAASSPPSAPSGGSGFGTGPAPSSPPSPPSGGGRSSDIVKAGRVHISGSLSRSICGLMKNYRSSKKLQDPLNDKDKFASGDNECSWLHWQQQCQSHGSCPPFLPKACDEVKVPAG